MRVGGFAVYATAIGDRTEAAVRQQFTTVAAGDWQRQRARLRAPQTRQTKMRRFHLHRDAYLADIETRWQQLTEPP